MVKTLKTRLSCLHEDDLMRLAMENYNFRLSIYNKELVEITRYICGFIYIFIYIYIYILVMGDHILFLIHASYF